MTPMYLTDAQVAEIAYQAGFRGIALTTAIAVSFAEDGNHDAHAVNTFGNHPASRDRGLWQINDYWHPEVSDAQAFDPLGNARAAYAISGGGTNWHPWATFNSGAYKQFMQTAARLAQTVLAHHTGYTLTRYLRETVDADGKYTTIGVDVKMVQAIVRTAPDGVFGPKTDAAVKFWQHSHGLVADGIVGPLTAATFGWGFSG